MIIDVFRANRRLIDGNIDNLQVLLQVYYITLTITVVIIFFL